MKSLNGNAVMPRPIEHKNLEKLNQCKNEETVYQNFGGGYMPVSIAIQEKWMDSRMDTSGNNKHFIIEILSGESVGMDRLYEINWIHRTCELGIYTGKKDLQRKGYGREAYRLLKKFAVRYLNLRKIKVYVVADNESAMKMYVHPAFKKVGELTEERFINGDYQSVTIMDNSCVGVFRTIQKLFETTTNCWTQFFFKEAV